MKLGIMQPYFLPYAGYFQLVAAADVFVVYDNIKFTKKGWINRNRLLRDGEADVFSLALKQGSDSLNVVDRELAPEFEPAKLLNRFKSAYSRAPFFGQTFPLLERILLHEERNLFRFIYHSIQCVCSYLGLATELRVSSTIPIDHGLKGQAKVLALCSALGAGTYINAIGGVELYAKDAFRDQGTTLTFIKSKPLEYHQLGDPFVPWLSIIDMLMFIDVESVGRYIAGSYELI